MSNPTNTEQPAADDLEQEATEEEMTEDVSPESGENPADEKSGPESNADGPADNDEGEDPDTFPRAYVEKLRRENADARAKLKDRDDLAARLHTALAAADGRLADPTDLPYDEGQLDPEQMHEAITDLVNRKPHLKARRVAGDAGQGPRGSSAAQVDLLGTLRGLAG